MRFAVAATLVIFATVFSSGAQAAGSYGGFFCNPPIPCNQASPDFPSQSQVLASANACVSQNMGFTPPDGGFFEDDSGIDSNGCLTTKSDALGDSNGSKAMPHCCIVQAPHRDSCILRCDMLAGQ